MSGIRQPCPLCSGATDDERELFVHLLVSHRKSEITRAYLARLDDRPDPPRSEGSPTNELLRAEK